MNMLTVQANHLREMAYTVERVKNDAVGKLSLSGSITLAMAAMDMRDAADTIAQLRNTCHDLQRENDELKQLVRDMWQAVPKTESCGWDSSANTCTGSDECYGECALWHRMHDLGIEVDDAPDEPMSDAARRVFDRLMSELDGDSDESR